MSGKIPREFIDDLLVRVDIVDVIDSHVPLKKMGLNYTTCCPFHHEKSPSFNVNRHKQFYHCFGCGAGGNVISFLMNFNQFSFIETIEELASLAGVEIPYENSSSFEVQTKNKRLDLQQLTAQVAEFYVEQLRNHPQKQKAVDYLKGRGIKGMTARDFRVGYAPEGWRNLPAHFNTELLCEAGLLIYKNEQYYDRFRQRIIFPIRNKRGHIIGFGGRILVETDKPKYLNSPETALFHKSNEVYGLYELLQKNSSPSQILIVEGYMDVITLAQFGIDYAVATLGTTLTITQLQLLFRSTSEVILCFDGDKAGQEAAWKAMMPIFSVLNDNRQARVLILPPKQDPDSLLHEEGTQAFLVRIKKAELISNYFFNHFISILNLNSIEGRSKLAHQAKPFLLKLADSFFKEMMLTKLQELSNFDLAPLLEKERIEKPHPPHNEDKNVRYSLEQMTFALLVQNPTFIKILEAHPIDWQVLDFTDIEVFKAIVQKMGDKKPSTTAQLLEYYRDQPEEEILNKLAFMPMLLSTHDNIEVEFLGALNKLIIQGGRQHRLKELQIKADHVSLDESEKEMLLQLTSVQHKN